MNEFDIVVIGAGAAGIAAAHAARAAKLTCQVLEANDRVGGRAFTDTASLSQPFDHGCQWLHAASINPLVPLADRLGIRYSKPPFAFRIHDGRWWLNDTLVAEFVAAMQAAYGRMDEVGRAGNDVAAATCLDPADRWTAAFRRNYTSYMAAPPEEVSVYDTSRFAHTDENWPVDDGFGSLFQRLAEGHEIRTHCPAKSVDWGSDQIMVGTPQGMLFARAVIVTVSTAVLAAERVKFFPLLPDWKQAAIAQVPLGFAEKIALEFQPDPFLGLETHFAVMDWAGAPPGGFLVHPFGRPVATLFLGGATARDLATGPEEAAVDFAKETLKTLFGADVARKVTRSKATRWAAEPLVGGAYSVLRPGGGEARAQLAEPVADRLFFAGEATSPDAFSTAHGAWQSGFAAVAAVKKVLG